MDSWIVEIIKEEIQAIRRRNVDEMKYSHLQSQSIAGALKMRSCAGALTIGVASTSLSFANMSAPLLGVLKIGC